MCSMFWTLFHLINISVIYEFVIPIFEISQRVSVFVYTLFTDDFTEVFKVSQGMLEQSCPGGKDI